LLDDELPDGPFLIVIDAGMLGSYANAKYLSEKDRRFIISVKGSRFSTLWKRLHRHCKELGEWDYLSAENMIALSFHCKKKKVVLLLSICF